MSIHISRRAFVAAAAAGGTVAGAETLIGGTITSETRAEPPEDLVVDASAPLASPARGLDAFRREVQARKAAGCDVVLAPVATREGAEAALRNVVALQNHIARLAEDAVLMTRAADLARVRPRTGVVACFQGLQMIGEQLGLIADFRAAGVSVMQLTGYWKNWNGDGCLEPGDLPMTGLGRMVVRAMADAGVVLDLAQAGRRTSLDALERSTGPVIVSRANAARVHAHPQNLTDDQIEAVRERDGVIGISAFPALLSPSPSPSLDDLLRHFDYLLERAGPDHVGIGLDFDDRPRRRFPEDELPDPPYAYPSGLSSASDLPRLRQQIQARGLVSEQINKIFGGNFLRVLARAMPSNP